MKKCPNCEELFSDDNMFCLNDGTSLLYFSEIGQNPPVFLTPGERPTQYFQPPPVTVPNNSSNNSKDSSKRRYLIIGILATALVGMGVFMWTMRSEKKETADQKRKFCPETLTQENRRSNLCVVFYYRSP